MREVILNFAQQFKMGLEKAKKVGIESQFTQIIICGVGGSALPGALLMDYLPDIKTPVYTHRSYGLPPQANAKSLIISVSFSGNTEETVSGYNKAIESGFQVIAITTGGELKQTAKEKGLPVVVVPNDCLQPRLGTGYLFSALLRVLANSGVIKDKTKEISELAETLNPLHFEDTGKLLAKKIKDKIPVVYSSNKFKSLARIWKIKFNENSKTMAFWNYFPELNHNEMVGYTRINQNDKSKCKNFHVIILRDENDNPKTLKRMKLTAELIKEAGTSVDFIDIQGRNMLEKMFSALILGDWTSYYLALEYGQDPLPVKIVEEFKQRLSQ